MASPVKVQVVAAEPQQLALARQLLNPKQFKQGLYQATKRTTNAGKKIFQEIVKERTFLQNKYIKRVITSRMSSGDIPVGTVEIAQQRIPLIGYLVTATKTLGVVAIISRGRPSIRLRHAFSAKLQTAEQAAAGFTGHKGIAGRARHLATKGPNTKKGKLTPRGFAGRFAIKEEFGPSVLQIIDRDEVTKEALGKLGNRFQKEILGQIDRFTKAKPPDQSEAA